MAETAGEALILLALLIACNKLKGLLISIALMLRRNGHYGT
ncbi:hypothetical protein ACFLX4_00435 [Chloroflexota bacterium]